MRNPPVKAQLDVARANFFEQRATGLAKAYARHMVRLYESTWWIMPSANLIQSEPARFNCITMTACRLKWRH